MSYNYSIILSHLRFIWLVSSVAVQAPVSVTGCREKPLPFTVAGTRPPTNTSPISCVPIAALENSVTETQWPPLIVRFSRQLFHPTLSPILQSNQVISLSCLRGRGCILLCTCRLVGRVWVVRSKILKSR